MPENDTNKNAFLSLRGVTKRFGEITALNEVDLDLASGELLVVLGPTGAGKTTLLRTIVGLESPEAGTVSIEGADVTAVAPAERNIALVFQNFSLYSRWTVRENMAFPLRAPGRELPESEIKERVEWAAEMLKIAHLLDRPSPRLSGGEMQRVAIGRAIVRRPRMFLMDEPLTNLDAKLREELRVELVRLQRELKVPTVFVTHDQVEALSMGDRIVVLSEGRILQSGSPEQVYRAPASPAVARQLGSPPINLLDVHAEEGHWVAPSGTPVMRQGDAPPAASKMILGVRPEDVALEGGAHKGVVQIVEDMGPIRILVVQWAGTEIHVTTTRGGAAKPGDEVYPLFDAAKVVLWPA